MNLKQLEAFVKVAETKNFSEAARQLYLTQPTVSAHVASLEKELDTSLLCRNTKKVELTDAGRELCVYAEEMLGIERKIREHFGLRGKEKRVLRIAASTIPSQYLLPRIMARYQEKYPGEQLRVMETDSAGAVEQIVSRRADWDLPEPSWNGKDVFICRFIRMSWWSLRREMRSSVPAREWRSPPGSGKNRLY